MNLISNLIILCLLILNSCTISKTIDLNKNNSETTNQVYSGLDKKDKFFILKRDSTRVLYDGLKIKNPLFSNLKFVINGDSSINAKDILAYQTENNYYTFTRKCGWTTKRTNLGKISTYLGEYEAKDWNPQKDPITGMRSNKTRMVYQAYLQKENGPLIESTADNLYDMIKKHKPSAELMDTYFENQSRIGKLQFKKSIKNAEYLTLAVDEYNNNYKGK
jgi:hypothetical protein